jgi:hypothetical protein
MVRVWGHKLLCEVIAFNLARRIYGLPKMQWVNGFRAVLGFFSRLLCLEVH